MKSRDTIPADFRDIWVTCVLAFALTVPIEAGAVLVEQDIIGGPGHAEIYPAGVGVTPSGNISVADTANDQVRLYTSDGTLRWTTGGHGSGVGQFDFPRDADTDEAGNIFITDDSNRRVVKLNPDGQWIKSWTGPATDPLGAVMGISVRGDKVYVAEPGKKSIRVLNLDLTAQLAKYQSNGACIFGDVRDVDADAGGNVYIANYPNKEVIILDSRGACLTKWQAVPDYGIRVQYDPILRREVVFASLGTISVYEKSGALISRIGRTGAQVTDWSDPAADIVPGALQGLRYFSVDSFGDVWAGDLWGYQVEHFVRTSTGWEWAGAIPDPIVPPPLADDATFNGVNDVAFGSDGSVSAIDARNNRVVRFGANGAVLNACGNRTTMGWPRGVAVDESTGQIWYPQSVLAQIRIIRPDCSSVAILATNNVKGSGIAIRQSDRLAFVADTPNNRVAVYNVASRTLLTTFGRPGSDIGGFRGPSGVAVDPISGNLLVADTNNNRVVELGFSSGAFSWIRSITGGFSQPQGVAADSMGRIYVADTSNRRVVVLDTAGNQLQVLEGLDFPVGVAVDALGKVYVSDTYNDVIRVFVDSASGSSVESCGVPILVPSSEAGLFLWEPTCGGAVRSLSVRALAGGSTTMQTYEGRIDSDLPFGGAIAYRLEPSDLLELLNARLQVHYQMNVWSPAQDGFSLSFESTAKVCFGVDLPAGALVRVGPNKTPVAAPFDLTTFKSCAGGSQEAWSSFRKDSWHRAYNSSETALSPITAPSLKVRWRVPINEIVMYSSPSVVNGVVYIGAFENGLLALDAASGIEKWRFPTDIGLRSSPAVSEDNGMVYVGDYAGRIYGIDLATGKERWAYQTGDEIRSSAAVVDGAVYIGSYDGNVYALDAASGARRWAFQTGSRVHSSPAVASGAVYVGSTNKSVYALDAETGKVNWRFQTGGAVRSSPAVGTDLVFVGSFDRRLYALDRNSGAMRWSFQTFGLIHSSPAVDELNGRVYVGSYDGNVYALDAATGRELWRFHTGDEIHSSPTVANGVVYIGSFDYKFYALNASTGSELWAFEFPQLYFPSRLPVDLYAFGPVMESSPAVIDGVVYASSWFGGIWAFE